MRLFTRLDAVFDAVAESERGADRSQRRVYWRVRGLSSGERRVSVEREEIKRYARGLMNWNAETAAPLAAHRAARFAEARYVESASDWRNIECQIAQYQRETLMKTERRRGSDASAP